MPRDQVVRLERRRLLQGVGILSLSLAGGSMLAGCANQVAPFFAGSPRSRPETTTLRLIQTPALCYAPQYVAEELLRAEGFEGLHYVQKQPAEVMTALASGEAHMSFVTAHPLIVEIDAGSPIVILAGGHVGCYELFGTDRVRTIRDLKDKTVAVTGLGSGRHLFLASMASYVGMDPSTEMNLIGPPPVEAMQLLNEGTIDAFMAFPPEPQELRAKRIGHVMINTTVDRPWSQYFCCMLAANREFVQRHPVATKLATRAILKSADICSAEPERASQMIVDRGFTKEAAYALQAIKELPYSRWREYDPEDTIRFYSLRLQEVGMIKSTPDTIIRKGTDWRFLNELKQELKA